MKKKMTIVLSLCFLLTMVGIIFFATKINISKNDLVIHSEYPPYQISLKNKQFFEDLADRTIRKKGYYNADTKQFESVNHIQIVITPEEQPLYKVTTDGVLSNSSNYSFQNGVLTIYVYIEPNLLATNTSSAIQSILYHVGLVLLSLSNTGGIVDSQGVFTKPYQDYFDSIREFGQTTYPIHLYK